MREKSNGAVKMKQNKQNKQNRQDKEDSAAENENFQIRRAVSEEYMEIYRVVSKAFEVYSTGLERTEHLEENPEDVKEDIEKHLVLVLEKYGREEGIAGSLRLEETEDGVYYLRRFAVLPAFQGQGLGSRLIKKAEFEVQKRGGKKIFLYSAMEKENLVEFYKNMGFNCREISSNLGYDRALWEKEIPVDSDRDKNMSGGVD